MSEILTINNLDVGYGDLQVLSDVSMEVNRNEISILMGPNGAGKSTLLKSIYNLVDIQSGEILLEEEEITADPAHELLQKGVSFVSQGKVNFDRLSVEENLLMGAHHIENEKKIKSKKQEVYEQFPVLKEKKNEYAFNLSGGQQQMVAIGRALMSSPKLLLMDEPSLGLAPKLVKELFEKIVEIKKNFDTTILIVEHNLKSLMEIADHGFVLVEGEIIASDKCENLKGSEVMHKVFVGEFD
ncbi:MAG: ABC transporter ATP-binding protein [Parcubacteria group bacterium QH_9_35_7]|nr:MAG: ABC transporter ATP-binding protein [Parcubacteria group bacterium QH_9_35_7]